MPAAARLIEPPSDPSQAYGFVSRRGTLFSGFAACYGRQTSATRELKFGKTRLLRGVRTMWTSPHHAEVAGRATLGIDALSESRTEVVGLF